MTRLAVVAGLVAALGGGAGAQQSAPAGARISGTVVTTDATPQAVHRAVVTIGGAGAEGRSVITDDQGRFEFTGLPAGRFTLTASKPAYLSNAYGAKTPGQPGTAITVAEGQTAAPIQIPLPRGAVVAGTIRDFDGTPAVGVQVYVVTSEDADAGRQITTESSVTDDRGGYRAFGLAPGTYVVVATPRVLGGGEMLVRSAAEIDEAIRQQQQVRAGAAPARPAGPPQTPAAAGSSRAPSKPLVAYAPTFYPGTARWSQATRVTLHAGDEQDAVDIKLDLVPAATLDGVVANPGGPVPELTLSLLRDGPSFPLAFGLTPSSSGRPGVAGNNAFRFTNVAPGHYLLTARTANMQTTIGPNGSMSTTQLPPGSVPSLWAQLDLDVNGDLNGLTLQLQPALTLSGRIAFDRTSLPVPDDLTKVRITMTSAAGVGMSSMTINGVGMSGPAMPPVAATAKADGTFEVSGLMPGRYVIAATAPGGGPAGWWLASAMVEGRDALDANADFTSGRSIPDATLTFSDRHASLTGSLQTPAGQPAPDYFIVVFPADKTLWRAGSRRIRSTRPASDGQFSFADLPPGAYRLAAVTNVKGDEWQKPAFLEEIGGPAVSVPVTVGPGEKAVQNLRISGGLASR